MPPAGQDAAFAERLSRKIVTTGGIIQAVERSISEGLCRRGSRATACGGFALAVDHGTRYPILQGPMTRVSDVPGFAQAVAQNGALPFLALALLREQDVRKLLSDAPQLLGARPWGVGILGFVPPDAASRTARRSARRQAAVRLDCRRPPRPGRRARARGHRNLLARTLAGFARPVLAGRSAAVRPRGSRMRRSCRATIQLRPLGTGRRDRRPRPSTGALAAEQVRASIFAGGIHDARSAALVAALAGPLAVRGVKVGILIGTAYLFTREAVSSGAIVPRFQDEVLRCEETVLLESGPGHQVRVSPTPFVARFREERTRLQSSGLSAEEIRDALEGLNVGRLRVATKGLDRSREQGSKLGGSKRRISALPTVSTCWARSPRSAARPPRWRNCITSYQAKAPISWTRLWHASSAGSGAERGVEAFGHRHHRHGGGSSGRRDGITVLVQHAPGLRRHHRNPQRPLELAAVLRPRSQGAGQDHLQMGRVSSRRAVRPDSLRDAAVEPSLDRAGSVDRARSGPDRAGRCRLRRSSVPPRNDRRRARHGRRGRPACDGLCLPLVPADARHGPARSRPPGPGSLARGCFPNGPRTRFPAFC